jgi:RimJ/RimL family protein N-acetyltransferase
MNAEKLFDSIVGFKEEGLLKEQFYFDGTYHDVIVFSLFRDDWFSNEK